MAKLLPLFPLQLVVFPRTQLPLHIFEDRYKEMVSDAIRNGSEFGIVLANEDRIAEAGCTVVVEKVVKQYADGRMDLQTAGRRRFEIQYLNQEKEYLRGEVTFFDDESEETAPAGLIEQAIEGYRELAEAGEARSYAAPILTDPQVSFQIVQGLKDVDFQSMCLRSRSEVERMRQLVEYLSQQVPKVKHTVRMRQLAPTNGFGHKPKGL